MLFAIILYTPAYVLLFMALLPFEKIKRNIVIKKEFSSNAMLGMDPVNRPVSKLIEYGVVNVNKPEGPNSHLVSDYVKKILNIDKAGHSGTLDPGVTGVLPIALGSATRIVQVLLPAGKEYVALMHIHKPVDEKLLKKTLNEFIGTITQLPPLKSAVKRQLRERNVYYLEIMELEAQDVLFRVGCEAGTYIRKLCHDIGRKLGVGAHMQQLVRTKAGPFTDKDMVFLQDLADAFWLWKNKNDESQLRKIIQPIEDALKYMPMVWVTDFAVDSLCHGAALNIPGICKLHDDIVKDDLVAIMTLKNELVALGTAVISGKDILSKDKGLAVRTHKVFMEPNVYPAFKIKRDIPAV